jgi:hypothetical protein
MRSSYIRIVCSIDLGFVFSHANVNRVLPDALRQ